jgi:hypothetical protein
MTESSVRKLAAKRGYLLRKSRRAISVDNHGSYMVIEASRNLIVLGSRFDATLDEIEEWLRAGDPLAASTTKL